MTQNLDLLRIWIRIALLVAAICTTSFPLLYGFFRWWRRPIGRLLMMQAASFAIAVDLSAVLAFGFPKTPIMRFWVDAVVLTLIAGSSAMLTGFMVKLNFFPKKEQRNEAQRKGIRRP